MQDWALSGTAPSWVRSPKRQKKCPLQNYLTESRTQHWCHWDGTGNYSHVRGLKAFIHIGRRWDGRGALGDSRWSWQLCFLIALDLLSQLPVIWSLLSQWGQLCLPTHVSAVLWAVDCSAQSPGVLCRRACIGQTPLEWERFFVLPWTRTILAFGAVTTNLCFDKIYLLVSSYLHLQEISVFSPDVPGAVSMCSSLVLKPFPS